MSTLKTANIQDTSGNNNSTPEQISQGRAKAWINFDGTAATIGSGRDNYNVSSVTDGGGGDYTVNFTNNMANANYCVIVSFKADYSPQFGSGAASSRDARIESITTSSTTIWCGYEGSTASGYLDFPIVCVAVFGD